MTYLDITHEAWDNILLSQVTLRGYPCLQIAFGRGDSVTALIYLDGRNNANFCIGHVGVDFDDSFFKEIQFDGLVTNVSMFEFNGITSPFINLMCGYSDYKPIFSSLIKTICINIDQNTSTDRIRVVKNTILKWKTFWNRGASTILSEPMQLGLICELLVLNKLCWVSTEIALDSWVGYLGEANDFILPGWDLEVKGCQKSRRSHIINGIDQLSVTGDRNLGLISFQTDKSDIDSELELDSLIQFIINEHFKNDLEKQMCFLDATKHYGYSPAYDGSYKKFRIDGTAMLFFEVTDAFPSLNRSSLVSPLSSRIKNITYSLNVDGLDGLTIDEVDWQALCGL